ncbi:MAG: type II toxin-antitoxin system VapC family toxin [Burkholderiales bacterium]
MRAADTNVLVRLVTRDDEAQCERAIRFFDDNDVFIPKTALLELEWVLRYSYALASGVIASAMLALLDTKRVVAEDETAVRGAITLMQSGLDFADALHLSSSGQCTDLATFDKAFVKAAGRLAPGRVATL